MNKKLLLSLGTLSLAILPVVAVVSCSADKATDETPIETEAQKEAKTYKDITSLILEDSASIAAPKITKETLDNYFTPKDTAGFTATFVSATAVEGKDEVTIELTIAKELDKATAKFNLTGFKALPVAP